MKGGMQIITSLKEKEHTARGELNQALFPEERRAEAKRDWHESFQCDRYKLEAVYRCGVGFLLGHIFSVAVMPEVVPPSFKTLVIIAVECLCLFPMVLFTIIGVFPTVLVSLIIIVAFATMLLAAASVSDGTLVGVFSIYAFWTISVYFGETYNKTWKMGQNLLGIVALFALGVRPLLLQAPQEERLEIVNQLWKQSGLDNSAAVFRNLMITACWGLAIILVMVLLPPFRTARSSISQELIPGVLQQTAAVLDGKLDKTSLVTSTDVLKQGSIAGMTLFEPPPPWTKRGFLVAELGAVVAVADKLILSVIAIETAIQQKFIQDVPTDKEIDMAKMTALIKAVAAALASNSTDDIDALEKLDVESSFASSPYYFVYETALTLRQVTLKYLHAYNPSHYPPDTQPSAKERASDFVKNKLKIWIAAPLFGWPKTMVLALASPFRPKTWNFRDFLWKLKRTLGAVILFSMVIYWPQYANFAINEDDWRLGSVFYGWDMLGYCNSWRPTLEGTIKKGLQRFLGACIGGFFAWIGVIICRGSYSDDAKINPYGLIAYLTVVTTGMAFGMFKTGLGARFGTTRDSFYVWMYSLVHVSLLALSTFTGQAEIGGLVVNRIVATATGVVMAWIVAVIPPFLKGGNPGHTYECLRTLDESLHSLLATYADKEKWAALGAGEAKAKFVHPAEVKRDFANFLLADAAMYDSTIRLYAANLTVNTGLKPLLADIQVTITLLSQLVDLFEAIKDGQDETLRTSISGMLDDGLRVDEEDTGVDVNELQGRGLVLVRIIHDRWQKHKHAWDAIDAETDNLLLVERINSLERQRDDIAREMARLRDDMNLDQTNGVGVQRGGRKPTNAEEDVEDEATC